MSMDIVICPGCGSDVPHDNGGCPHCGYEDGWGTGRLLTVRELLGAPSYPEAGALQMNNVCPEFLKKAVAAAAAERDALAARLAEPVRLTDAEIEHLWYQSRGVSAPFARATEDAVLERNGLKPIPTAVTVAPRGYSWHGDRLQKDELGTLTRNPQLKGD